MKKFIIIILIILFILFFFTPVISSNVEIQPRQECLEHSTGLEVFETPYIAIKNSIRTFNFNKKCKVVDQENIEPSIPYN